MIRRFLFLIPLTCSLSTPAPAAAQPEADTTQVNALRCWRQVSRNAVYVGERFTMTVTCSVVETDNARTLADQTALEPEAIDVTPFEVLEGEHFEDIRTGPYRYFQYHYTLRVITESNFGEDIEIPALDITYRIERRIGNNPALLGREPIRVVSLVPDATGDIRDVAPATFGDAQARVFRANALTLLAALAGVVAIGVVALGAVRVARERRGGAAPVDKRLSPMLVVHRALGELSRVQQATADRGWSVESAGRALAALRLGGSVAVSAPLAQSPVEPDTAARDGQLRLRTAAEVTRRLEQLRHGRRDGADAALADDLGRAISVFTAARYSRNGSLPTDELTRELDTGIAQLTRLRWRSAAPVRYAQELKTLAGGWWKDVWTR